MSFRRLSPPFATVRLLAGAVAAIAWSVPLSAQPAAEPGAEEPPPPDEPLPPEPTPPPAPTPPPPATGPLQVFPLKNGTVIEGRVVQQAPGQWVTIETKAGWRVTLPWQQIGQSEKPAEPPPDQATVSKPAPADEEPSAPTGLRLGLRAGAAFPVGKIESGDQTELSRTFGTAIPLTANVGVQASKNFYVGLYATWVLGSAGSDADTACSQVDCSAYGARLGLDVELRLPSDRLRATWFSYSIGWSADEIDLKTAAGTEQHAWGGLDFATLLGGVDFPIGEHNTLGPFGGAGLSLYLYEVDAVDGTGHDKSVHDPALHGFIQVGIRSLFFP